MSAVYGGGDPGYGHDDEVDTLKTENKRLRAENAELATIHKDAVLWMDQSSAFKWDAVKKANDEVKRLRAELNTYRGEGRDAWDEVAERDRRITRYRKAVNWLSGALHADENGNLNSGHTFSNKTCMQWECQRARAVLEEAE